MLLYCDCRGEKLGSMKAELIKLAAARSSASSKARIVDAEEAARRAIQ
jgi:hypothetical protein